MLFFISCQSAVKFGPQNSKMRLKAPSKQCFTKHTSDQPSSTKLQILTFHGWNFSSILWKKNSSAVISCQSVVKLYLQKLLNLTQLGSSTLNKTLFNILLKFKLGKHFNLGPLTNYLEFDLIFVCWNLAQISILSPSEKST